jgi:hypothetical protein
LRLWLEQKKNNPEGKSCSILRLPRIHCSSEQKKELERMAKSRTLGIWRMKRAKVILGTLDGKALERLVLDVRVPPETIVKCVEAFSKQGIKSLQNPTRRPTARETRVEKMLKMLEKPSKQKGQDWRHFTIRYIGIDFTGPMIESIRALTIARPGVTRVELSQTICRNFGFYSPAGKLKDKTIIDIMKRMDMDNLIRLPKVKHYKSHRKKKKPPPPLLDEQETQLWHHKDFEPLTFLLIREAKQQHLWNDMMSRHHYLKKPRLFGPQLRYLIRGANSGGESEDSGSEDYMLLGAISFSPAAWRLASRDAFIGWDEQQREKHLNQILGNSRFLILPWIKCPNLASMILGRIAGRVTSDWKTTYGIEPVLLETFVQQDRFSGTCYRAANWIDVGSTGGYSYFSIQKKNIATKTIFLYPLCKNFREILCSPPTSQS